MDAKQLWKYIDMKKEPITIDRVIEICTKVMTMVERENISATELGEAVFTLFVTGCVNSKLSDTAIDKLLARAKSEIQKQR